MVLLGTCIINKWAVSGSCLPPPQFHTSAPFLIDFLHPGVGILQGNSSGLFCSQFGNAWIWYMLIMGFREIIHNSSSWFTLLKEYIVIAPRSQLLGLLFGATQDLGPCSSEPRIVVLWLYKLSICNPKSLRQETFLIPVDFKYFPVDILDVEKHCKWDQSTKFTYFLHVPCAHAPKVIVYALNVLKSYLC